MLERATHVLVQMTYMPDLFGKKTEQFSLRDVPVECFIGANDFWP